MRRSILLVSALAAAAPPASAQVLYGSVVGTIEDATGSLVPGAIVTITNTLTGMKGSDGSWGYYLPTAEETAYCLQALIAWNRHGGQVPDEALQRGAAWLAEQSDPPYPPLWIGKCLYSPVLVVRAAILSALMMLIQV